MTRIISPFVVLVVLQWVKIGRVSAGRKKFRNLLGQIRSDTRGREKKQSNSATWQNKQPLWSTTVNLSRTRAPLIIFGSILSRDARICLFVWLRREVKHTKRVESASKSRQVLLEAARG